MERSTMMWLAALASAIAGPAAATRYSGGTAADRAGIEALHRLDESTTVSNKADELVKLWDKDAVRLSSGQAPEVGRAVIYAHDKAWEKTQTSRIVAYHADVQDVQIVGGIAFEWSVARGTMIPKPGAPPVTMKGKQLRVMKRQADGSWKFLRVMGTEETS